MASDKRRTWGTGINLRGLCRLNQASLAYDSQLSSGNTLGCETQFSIIRKAALYAGHGPATVQLFVDLWGEKQ